MLPLVPPHDRVIPASTARHEMKDGDILLWHGDYWVSKMFERVTGSTYSTPRSPRAGMGGSS
jgi:hypothetical protein